MKAIMIRLGPALAALAASFFSFAPAGCGTTGSERFTFDAAAGGIERDASQPLTFENEKGWTITLRKADVTFGPVYLNVLAPLRSARLDSTWSFLRSAHADDSHLGGGRNVGEVLAQIKIDALSPTLVPFAVPGTMTQEQVRTAEIWFWPAPGTSPEASDPNAVALDLAGEAVRAGKTVRFRGQLIFDEAWSVDAKPGNRSATPLSELRKVRGIGSSFFPEAGGRLQIRVDVRPLLRGADFTSLANSFVDADGITVLAQAKTGKFTTDQVMRNIYQGLRAPNGTYEVQWVTP